MRRRDFDVPPVLNVLDEEASIALEPTRESFDEVVDGGWHFEDDLLLGYPAAARFRLHVDGRTYTPVFEHVHVGHGGGPAHANEHATGAHAHGPGPRGGVVLTLGAHRAHVEVVHKAHWGILGLYVYDAAMTPRGIDEAPVLNVVCDDEPLQLTAGTRELGRRGGRRLALRARRAARRDAARSLPPRDRRQDVHTAVHLPRARRGAGALPRRGRHRSRRTLTVGRRGAPGTPRGVTLAVHPHRARPVAPAEARARSARSVR